MNAFEGALMFVGAIVTIGVLMVGVITIVAFVIGAVTQ